MPSRQVGGAVEQCRRTYTGGMCVDEFVEQAAAAGLRPPRTRGRTVDRAARRRRSPSRRLRPLEIDQDAPAGPLRKRSPGFRSACRAGRAGSRAARHGFLESRWRGLPAAGDLPSLVRLPQAALRSNAATRSSWCVDSIPSLFPVAATRRAELDPHIGPRRPGDVLVKRLDLGVLPALLGGFTSGSKRKPPHRQLPPFGHSRCPAPLQLLVRTAMLLTSRSQSGEHRDRITSLLLVCSFLRPARCRRASGSGAPARPCMISSVCAVISV